MSYVPERGDAIWINFDPQSGREQAGRRPALVLSPSAYNGKVGLALICPITSQTKEYAFEVKIPERSKVKGVILSDHVKSADWRTREIKFICRLPESVIEDVLDKLSVLFRAGT